MSDEQPGLRLRLAQEARRIGNQHRQIDALAATLSHALSGADEGAGRSAFLRFRDALTAHMSLENEVHFPALHGLHPEFEQELTHLAREHGHFHGELDELARGLDQGDRGACVRRLEDFVSRFSAHEAREEKLMEQVRIAP
jgi:hypothetical protein